MGIICENEWSCIPRENTNNKYAIFFGTTNNLAFAVANVIMGLNQHSPDLMKQCDVLIYSSDISEKNKQLISLLHKDTVFLEVSFPEDWHALTKYTQIVKAGYPLEMFCSLFGFFLVTKYERVLFLEADLQIRGDIYDLFQINEPIAWRRVLRNTQQECKAYYNADDDFSICNGGLICFSYKLNSYGIDYIKEIAKWSDFFLDDPREGHNENIISCLIHESHIPVSELDRYIYNTPVHCLRPETRICHFIGAWYFKPNAKPWTSLASYLYFDDFAENYTKWLDMGGDGSINWTKEDYYNLFGVDKEKKLKKQKLKYESLEAEHKALEVKYKDLGAEYKALEAKYNAIRNSKSWKLTAPLRKCAKWFGKLMKKLKKRH